MTRPSSIVMFERLYLGSLAIWLIGLVVFWRQFQERIIISTAHSPAQLASLIGYIVWGSIVFAILVTLVLWYYVARRASLTASWIVIVFEAIGAISLVMSLIRLLGAHGGQAPDTWVNLFSSVLSVAAAVFLLRPDARAWLNASQRDPGVTTL